MGVPKEGPEHLLLNFVLPLTLQPTRNHIIKVLSRNSLLEEGALLQALESLLQE